jgi:OOP family OmpA-OmpF porin
MQKLSLSQKLIAAAVLALIAYFAMSQLGIGPAFKRQAAAVPKTFALPSEAPVTAEPAAKTIAVTSSDLPSTSPAPKKGLTATLYPIRIETIPWNGTLGLQLAIGGPATTKGSLMEKRGLNVELRMEKDSMVSQASQVKFATDYANGNENPNGPAFVIIMGDGTAQYLAGINSLLTKLGPEYLAENVGHVGYSRGEDGWWGPEAWKNPEAMKGGVTAGVILDGDWNIAQFKLAADQIKNNPDEKTWDPDAMNWIAAPDFEKAVEMYVAGYCEDRPVVRDGKLTNEAKHKTCVEGVVTWTPADVSLAKNKGGLVRLLSTKENPYQMPTVLIGIHKWNVAHAKQVKDLLGAAYAAGDQVKSSSDALLRGAAASAAVYGENNAAYWAKYYVGSDGQGHSADGKTRVPAERDKTGQPVPLGGSSVATLADALAFYGMSEGTGGPTGSLWRATYEGFGNIAKQQYPKRVPDFPKYDVAFNPMFLRTLASEKPADADIAKADLPSFNEGAIEKSERVASRDWSIQFDTGRSTITAASQGILEQVYTQLQQGQALAVEIDGHTDNVGDARKNQQLSEERAFAVKAYLQNRAPKLFPENRVNARGFGDTQPKASNATAEGKATNRRVTIILGNK